MPELKIGTILDEKPVKRGVTFSGGQDRLLGEYTRAVSEAAKTDYAPEQLIPQMVERFILSDPIFRKLRKQPSGRRKATGKS